VPTIMMPPGSAHCMVPAPSGPAPIPAGTEPFFGYSNPVHAVYTNLICTSSYACTNNP
jgi:hypothetical protein